MKSGGIVETLSTSLAVAIVTWCVAGFVILFGVLTLLPIAHDVLLLRRPSAKERVGLVKRYSFRFISRFTKGCVIFVLILASTLYLIAGILSFIFLRTGNMTFLGFGYYLTLVSTGGLVLLIIIVAIHALLLEEKEFETVQKYVPTTSD